MKADPKQLNQLLKEAGYKFLGWQNGWSSNEVGDFPKDKYPEYNACLEAGHQCNEVSHNDRGSENTISCDICKIYYKYDCSD